MKTWFWHATAANTWLWADIKLCVTKNILSLQHEKICCVSWQNVGHMLETCEAKLERRKGKILIQKADKTLSSMQHVKFPMDSLNWKCHPKKPPQIASEKKIFRHSTTCKWIHHGSMATVPWQCHGHVSDLGGTKLVKKWWMSCLCKKIHSTLLSFIHSSTGTKQWAKFWQMRGQHPELVFLMSCATDSHLTWKRPNFVSWVLFQETSGAVFPMQSLQWETLFHAQSEISRFHFPPRAWRFPGNFPETWGEISLHDMLWVSGNFPQVSLSHFFVRMKLQWTDRNRCQNYQVTKCHMSNLIVVWLAITWWGFCPTSERPMW